MRISEEIDALEVMAIRSVPFLVTCRVIAGMIAVVPLYVIGLLVSFFGSRVVTVYFYGQSAGTYDHYFTLFLPPGDILLSFLKVLFFSVLIMLVHCYYGFTAKGGPAGVGAAVGRAIRLSIVSVSVLDFFLSLAVWGSTTTVRISG
jgi:phospholipid/cholesterol/gamma-HCH transport system permease protein